MANFLFVLLGRPFQLKQLAYQNRNAEETSNEIARNVVNPEKNFFVDSFSWLPFVHNTSNFAYISKMAAELGCCDRVKSTPFSLICCQKSFPHYQQSVIIYSAFNWQTCFTFSLIWSLPHFDSMLFLLSFRPNSHKKYMSVYSLPILMKRRIPCHRYPLYQRLAKGLSEPVNRHNLNKLSNYSAAMLSYVGIHKLKEVEQISWVQYNIGCILKMFSLSYIHYIILFNLY